MNHLGITNFNRAAYVDLVNPQALPLIKEIIKEQALNDIEDSRPAKAGSRIKVIVSGGVVEVWNYEIPVRVGKRHISKYFDEETGERILTGGEYDPEAAKENNSRRAKNEFRRLILSNFDNNSKFVTLTFRDGSVSNVRDVKECNAKFTAFARYLKKKYGDFKYCKVIEFQDSNSRGAVHYHVVSNLPYIPADDFAEMWGNGFIGINRISHVDNLGAYISKYMVKDFSDIRLWKEKSYTTSRGNLVRPVVLFGKEAYEIREMFLKDKKEVFSNSYESEYQGKTTYKEYNLNRV